MADKKIIEQSAKEMPDMKDVKLKMQNLHLHASGVFSNVYKGTLLMSNGHTKEIAIKKTWPENRERNFEMIFLTGVSRERHKNIVQMLYAFSNRSKDDKICESFVFDFMPDTLASVIKNVALDNTDIKIYTWQLFTGLKYLSSENIVHRDIKPVNILVDHVTGLLKIGDFGSAKIIHHGAASTAYQVTRFYRPPELLLGSTHYNCSVDLWSAGCVVGEMLRRQVLFAGRDAKHQIKLIFATLGLPSESDIKAMRVPTKLENKPEERIAGAGIAALMNETDMEGVFFLGKILVYKPKERLGGRELLRNPFFDSILKDRVKRSNGQFISSIITVKDINEAQSVDERKNGSKLSALMNKKVEFVFGAEDRKKLMPSKSDESEDHGKPEKKVRTKMSTGMGSRASVFGKLERTKPTQASQIKSVASQMKSELKN